MVWADQGHSGDLGDLGRLGEVDARALRLALRDQCAPARSNSTLRCGPPRVSVNEKGFLRGRLCGRDVGGLRSDRGTKCCHAVGGERTLLGWAATGAAPL